MTGQYLVSRAEFARMAEINVGTLSRMLKNNFKCVLVGNRVDANHKEAKRYLKNREIAKKMGWANVPAGADLSKINGVPSEKNVRSTGLKKGVKSVKKGTAIIKPEKAPKKTREEKATEKKHSNMDGIPEDMREFSHMSLLELTQRFGTDTAFLDWLKATKTIEDINEKRLKNAASMGELVSKDLIKRGILDPIESTHVKLLTDGVKTISIRVSAMAIAGKDILSIEKYVASQISSFIKPVKDKVSKILSKC